MSVLFNTGARAIAEGSLLTETVKLALVVGTSLPDEANDATIATMSALLAIVDEASGGGYARALVADVAVDTDAGTIVTHGAVSFGSISVGHVCGLIYYIDDAFDTVVSLHDADFTTSGSPITISGDTWLAINRGLPFRPPIDGQSVILDAGTVLDAGADAMAPGDQILAYRPARTLASCGTTINTKVVTVTSTAGLRVGQGVSGPGIPAGAVIDAVGSGTITLNENASATGTVTLTFDKLVALYPLVDSGSPSDSTIWSSLLVFQTILGIAFAQPIYTEPGTSFAASGTDSGSGRLVVFTSSSAVSCSLDSIPVGQTARFLVAGTGQVTWTLGTGTLLKDGATAKSARQGARVWAQRIDSTTVHLWGSLAAS